MGSLVDPFAETASSSAAFAMNSSAISRSRVAVARSMQVRDHPKQVCACFLRYSAPAMDRLLLNKSSRQALAIPD